MQYVEYTDDDGYVTRMIKTGERDLNGDEIIVTDADGYGRCDITIGCHTMRWSDLDALKDAIAEAEKRWRTNE